MRSFDRIDRGCFDESKNISNISRSYAVERKPSQSRKLYIIKSDCHAVEESCAIVLTSTMGDLTFAEKAGMHYMYDRASGNGRAVPRMYYTQFPFQLMPDHRMFQQYAHTPGCSV
ncbi:hypothetical protein TNCV_4239561 [Trichonephila clavipes]|nr:hypothetical protein TNCV_4239561 [Trichonephila clavipes]